MPRLMEHTTNHIVGLALQRLLPHHKVAAEHAPRRGDRGKKPDIDIQHGETRIVLEAKRDNKEWAARDAVKRFPELDPRPVIVGALSYSKEFSDENAAEAIRAGAEFKFAFANSAAPGAWDRAWRTGTVYDLAQAIRHPGDMGVGARDEVAEAVQKIRTALCDVAASYNTTGAAARNAIARVLQVEENDDAVRVGGLIVANALMFYNALRHRKIVDKRGGTYRPPDISRKPPVEVCEAWANVRKRVNYAAILELAELLVSRGGMTVGMLKSLQGCAQVALPMAQSGVDLLGRVFHEVLDQAKAKAAFYTSIPGAVMMSELALDPDAWEDVDWADPKSVGKLCVCDPACGSGTLASALAWKIRDNHLRAALSRRGWEKQNGDALRELQKRLVEDVMWGYDISHAAVHMTATTLGLISPDVDFDESRIFAVHIGPVSWGKPRLGSLNYLDRDAAAKEFKEMAAASGARAIGEGAAVVPPPMMDLCAMNPPFVSGRKGSEMFDFIEPESARKATMSAFKKMGGEQGFRTGRGQGPPFAVMGARNVKPGGRLAMILPSTLMTGFDDAWTDARREIEDGFNLESVVVLRDPKRQVFSDSAKLSECMVVARKLRAGEKPSAAPALFVSLHKYPARRETALAASRAIRDAAKGGKIYGDILVGGKLAGKYARLPYRGRDAWFGCNFADLRLAFTANDFAAKGTLRPYAKCEIPVRELGEMTAKSYGSNDLHRACKKWGTPPSQERSRYPCYWPAKHAKEEFAGVGHEGNHNLREAPHCWVSPLPGKEAAADVFYRSAGRLVFSDSFRFNTSRRIASLMDVLVQSSHGVPVRLLDESENRYKALTLWLASTPGILMMARGFNITDGSKVNVAHGHARRLPVVDLDRIGEDKVNAMAAYFDEFVESGAALAQLQEIAGDAVRAELDNKVAQILGNGDLEEGLQLLREALGREPLITNRPVEAV